jgi:hypothetical protein
MPERPTTRRPARRRQAEPRPCHQERFRTVSEPRSPRCQWCSDGYVRGRRGEPQRYCSARCRKRAWQSRKLASNGRAV